MDEINQIVEELGLENQLTIDDIPQIDLYMDQVIQLFENQYGHTTRDENEKVLTKTMINNYAKGKLFIPIKNKKYSQAHLILINMIYQLKGALSINDIKKTLDGINKGIMADELSLPQFYQSYLRVMETNVADFQADMERKNKEVKEAITAMEGQPNLAEIEKVLLIASLVNMSNFYRRTAEKLIDQLKVENDTEKKK